jgi:hypothetical protein
MPLRALRSRGATLSGLSAFAHNLAAAHTAAAQINALGMRLQHKNGCGADHDGCR